MSTAEVTNGSANLTTPDISRLTPEQLRSLRSQIAKHDRRNVKRKPKPILNSLGEVESLDLKAKIQKSQTEWDYLKTGMPFVTDITAALIYVKTGVSRAMCLNTMQSVPVGGGMVHRVFL
jgi:hypothetical protein